MKHKYLIGVDVGGTKIEAAVLDNKGAFCFRQRLNTPAGHYEQTLHTIKTLIEHAEKKLDMTFGSVGIGTPGAMSPYSGKIKNANSTCLNGRNLKQDLERTLQRKIRLSNDANCFALSEAIDGSGADARSIFGVILGTGTGGGLVFNKQLIQGRNLITGEWGHNPLPWPGTDELPGPDCYCGRQGCIETWLSGPAMSLDHFHQTGRKLNAEEIHQAVLDQDPQCETTLRRYEHRLARGLAHVINIFDPDVIVLGGGLSNIKSLYTNIPKIWSPFIFSDHIETVLSQPAHGDSSGVRGAAWLFRQ